MIEVGSFIGMAAMTRSELTIKNVSYENLGIIPASFRRLGITMEQWEDDIYVPAQETYQIEMCIRDRAYTKYGICRLDCITTVVDALRLQSEFSCGDDLTRKGIDAVSYTHLSGPDLRHPNRHWQRHNHNIYQ